MFLQLIQNLRMLVLLVISTLLLTACGTGDEDAFLEAVEVNELGILSITVTSNNSIMEVGATEQYTAETDIGTSVTDKVKWTSSNSDVVSINQSGLATGLANGLVEITASLADISDSKELTSSDADLLSIEIQDVPVAADVCKDGYALKAMGTYGDEGGDTIRDITHLTSWVSSDTEESLLKLGNSDLGDDSADDKGYVSTYSAGNATITASRNRLSDSASVPSPGVTFTVSDTLLSVDVTPINTTIFEGSTQQFIATGTYTDSEPADISNTVEWDTGVSGVDASDDSLLSISNVSGSKGLATAVVAGIATVTATCKVSDADPEASTALDVTVKAVVILSSIQINTGDATVTVNVEDETEDLTAKLIFSDGSETDVTDHDDTLWYVGTVLNGEAATVSDEDGSKGEVSFTAVGITTIHVRYSGDEGTQTISIEVEVE